MKYKLGILGLGKMGNSILSGIVKSNLYKKEEILLFDVNETVKSSLERNGFKFSNNEKELFENVDMVIVAIKPQMFNNLLSLNLKDLNLVVISIAAGKTINDLKEIFGDQKFVRVMPNTPALILSSASALARGENVDDETFDNVKKIFESVGIIAEIEESKMNEVIPVNGSMPAYLYYFVQPFIDEAVNNGLDYEISKKLACEAVIGSARMILETNKPIDELIKDVCSPGGTTLAGLDVLKEEEFQEIIKKCFKACVNRAYELSKK